MHIEAALRVEAEVLELSFEMSLHLQEVQRNILAWTTSGSDRGMPEVDVLVDERVGFGGLLVNGDFAKAAVLNRESFESKTAARTGFDIVLEVGAMHRQGGGS
jgi:hypothetical protein